MANQVPKGKAPKKSGKAYNASKTPKPKNTAKGANKIAGT